MKKRIFSLFIALLLFSTTTLAETLKKEKTDLNFKADKYERDLKDNIIRAEGNVVISYGTDYLRADRVEIFLSTHEVYAEGNIILQTADTYLKADRAKYNFITKRGELINGYLKSGDSQLWGRKVEKVGDKSYIIDGGTFTTCEGCPGEAYDWKVWGSKIKATLNKYATVEHPVFVVKKLPVAYFPFGFYPLNRKRQSGFLFPEFAYSEQRGAKVKNLFYWAMDDWHDSTLSLEYLSKRGLKEGLEYRFSLTPESFGQFDGYLVKDRYFEKEKGTELEYRYGVDYNHQLFFESRIHNKLRGKLVSDDEYVKDFPEDAPGREEAGLEGNFILGTNQERCSLNAEAVYYEDLLSVSPIENNNAAPYKLPEITFGLNQFNYLNLPFYFSFNSIYTNFTTENQTFIDANNNGTFDLREDKLLRAQRLDLLPQLSWPFKLEPYFEFIQDGYFRETLYWLPRGDKQSLNRNLFGLGSQILTNINRVYDYQGEEIKKIKHEIEPQIKYSYTLFAEQGLLPQFDDIDRIGATSLISYSLDNRLIVKSGAQANYQKRVGFKLSQGLELRDLKGEQKAFKDLVGDLDINIKRFSLNTDFDLDVYEKDFTNLSSGVSYEDEWQDKFMLNYTYSQRDLEKINHAINGGIAFGFVEDLKFYFKLNYSFSDGIFLDKSGGVTYLAPSNCWTLNLNFEDAVDRGVSFNVGVNLVMGAKQLPLGMLAQENQRRDIKLFKKKEVDKFFEK